MSEKHNPHTKNRQELDARPSEKQQGKKPVSTSVEIKKLKDPNQEEIIGIKSRNFSML